VSGGFVDLAAAGLNRPFIAISRLLSAYPLKARLPVARVIRPSDETSRRYDGDSCFFPSVSKSHEAITVPSRVWRHSEVLQGSSTAIARVTTHFHELSRASPPRLLPCAGLSRREVARPPRSASTRFHSLTRAVPQISLVGRSHGWPMMIAAAETTDIWSTISLSTRR